MPRFRTFERTWWRDSACTEPGAGRKRYDGRTFETEAQARAACARENEARPGCWRRSVGENGNRVRELIPNRGPRGRATEFEAF